MKKGISKAIWLIVEIVLVIIAIIIIANLVGVVSDWSESQSTSASAYKLTEAINAVAERQDEDYNETVEIWMPQSSVDSPIYNTIKKMPGAQQLLGGGADPKWVIYYGDEINAKHIVSYAGGDALDIIEVIEHEADWDHYPRICSEEEGKVCYGFFERDLKPKYSNLKLKYPNRVKPFWILSPCKANVTVFYDGSKVNFCYHDDGDGYCHGKIPIGGQIFSEIDDYFGGIPGDLINALAGSISSAWGDDDEVKILKNGWPERDYSVFTGHSKFQGECS